MKLKSTQHQIIKLKKKPKYKTKKKRLFCVTSQSVLLLLLLLLQGEEYAPDRRNFEYSFEVHLHQPWPMILAFLWSLQLPSLSFNLMQALLPLVCLPLIQQNGRLIAICFQCYLRFSEKGERIETTESKIQRRLQKRGSKNDA